jgi:hypothetical protein
VTAIVPPPDVDVEDPEYWRSRAEEARNTSQQMHDAHAKALMSETAETYERIAEQYERAAERHERIFGQTRKEK